MLQEVQRPFGCSAHLVAVVCLAAAVGHVHHPWRLVPTTPLGGHTCSQQQGPIRTHSLVAFKVLQAQPGRPNRQPFVPEDDGLRSL